MSSHNPPHIHWIPTGEHAGLYVLEPAERWARIDLERGTIHPGGDLPPGSDQLFSSDDVESALDFYREALEGGLGSSPEGPFDLDRVHEATEIVQAVSHSALKDLIFQDLLCSDD